MRWKAIVEWLSEHWIFISGEYLLLAPLSDWLEHEEEGKLPAGAYRLEWSWGREDTSEV